LYDASIRAWSAATSSSDSLTSTTVQSDPGTSKGPAHRRGSAAHARPAVPGWPGAAVTDAVPANP
jgi:hypothetical protein